jgi:hypothetical protein
MADFWQYGDELSGSKEASRVLVEVVTSQNVVLQLSNGSWTQFEMKYLSELSSFTSTRYCETAHHLTPGFLVYCPFHIHIIILHLMRAECYFLLVPSHPILPFMLHFVQIFS